MKALKIYYHDGSIQVCTPKQVVGDPSSFIGDWGGLAETVAGHHYHREHAYRKHEVI